MANICTNQLIISNEAFLMISHLFTQPEESYENPYLDFEKVKPVLKDSTAMIEWSLSCRPYNTHIMKDNKNTANTIIEFQTHSNAPHGAIEALVRLYKFPAELYSFEPGCHYGCITTYEFDDGFDLLVDDVSDFISIDYNRDDLNEPCLKIFGLTYDEYVA